MTDQITDSLLTAINYISNRTASQLSADKTISAEITKIIDPTIGKYQYFYDGGYAYAYTPTNQVSYAAGDLVYILVPQGDYSNQKIIMGLSDVTTSQKITDITTNSLDDYLVISNNMCGDQKPEYDINVLYNKKETDDEEYVNLIGFNELDFAAGCKEATGIYLGADFYCGSIKNNTGNFGLSFTFCFEDTTVAELDENDEYEFATTYITYNLDLTRMEGNPYKQTGYRKQHDIYSIFGEKMQYLKSIEFFSTFEDLAIEPKVKNIQIYLLGDTDDTYGDYTIYFTRSNLTLNSISSKEKINIAANVKYKDSDITEDCTFYWGYVDNTVAAGGDNYNKNLGAGFYYVENENLSVLTVTGDDVTAAEMEYTCVAVYKDVITMSKSVKVYNNARNFKISIKATPGTQFPFCTGNVTLECEVEGVDNPFECDYLWSRTDGSEPVIFDKTAEQIEDAYDEEITATQLQEKNLKLKQLENVDTDALENKLHGYKFIYKTNDLTGQLVFTCAIYDKSEKFLGSASITIEDKAIVLSDAYTVDIVNGDQLFEYSQSGVSPASDMMQNPIEIQKLSVNLYAPSGTTVKPSSIKWIYPHASTLIDYSALEDVHIDDNSGDYYIYSNTFPLAIKDTYNSAYTSNTITAVVTYEGVEYTGTTSFTFTKIGENGSNGTDSYVKIDDLGNDQYQATLYINSTKVGATIKWYDGSGEAIDEQYVNDSTNVVTFAFDKEEDNSNKNKILKVECGYDDKKYYGYKPIVVSEKDSGITIDESKYITGIYYDADCTNPSYDINQGIFFDTNDATYTNIVWTAKGDNITVSKTPGQIGEKEISVVQTSEDSTAAAFYSYLKSFVKDTTKSFYETMKIKEYLSQMETLLSDYTVSDIDIVTQLTDSLDFEDETISSFLKKVKVEIETIIEHNSLSQASEAELKDYITNCTINSIIGDDTQKENETLKNFYEREIRKWVKNSGSSVPSSIKLISIPQDNPQDSDVRTWYEKQFVKIQTLWKNSLTSSCVAEYSTILMDLRNLINNIDAYIYVIPNSNKFLGEDNQEVVATFYDGDHVVDTFYCPIHLMVNAYGYASINGWDGQSVSTEDGNVMGVQVGAGRKSSKDNSFTGILMGDLTTSNSGDKIGLMGFKDGLQSMFLDAQTGTARFGFAEQDNEDEGIIELVPGGTSRIANWKIGRRTLSNVVDGEVTLGETLKNNLGLTWPDGLSKTDSTEDKYLIPPSAYGIVLSADMPYINVKGIPFDLDAAKDINTTAYNAVVPGDSFEIQLDPDNKGLFSIVQYTKSIEGNGTDYLFAYEDKSGEYHTWTSYSWPENGAEKFVVCENENKSYYKETSLDGALATEILNEWLSDLCKEINELYDDFEDIDDINGAEDEKTAFLTIEDCECLYDSESQEDWHLIVSLLRSTNLPTHILKEITYSIDNSDYEGSISILNSHGFDFNKGTKVTITFHAPAKITMHGSVVEVEETLVNAEATINSSNGEVIYNQSITDYVFNSERSENYYFIVSDDCSASTLETTEDWGSDVVNIDGAAGSIIWRSDKEPSDAVKNSEGGYPMFCISEGEYAYPVWSTEEYRMVERVGIDENGRFYTNGQQNVESYSQMGYVEALNKLFYGQVLNIGKKDLLKIYRNISDKDYETDPSTKFSAENDNTPLEFIGETLTLHAITNKNKYNIDSKKYPKLTVSASDNGEISEEANVLSFAADKNISLVIDDGTEINLDKRNLDISGTKTNFDLDGAFTVNSKTLNIAGTSTGDISTKSRLKLKSTKGQVQIQAPNANGIHFLLNDSNAIWALSIQNSNFYSNVASYFKGRLESPDFFFQTAP